MTKQFDDFRAALGALCIEHGIRMTSASEYDDYDTCLEIATDKKPAGCEIDFVEYIPPTPEEQAELDRLAEEEVARQRVEAAHYDELMRKRMEWAASPEFAALFAENQRQANLTRESSMRVSTNPTDPAYIDGRPRKVWLNDVEISGWIVADEFRRCVIVPGVEYQMLEDPEPSRTPDRVLNGAVRIERLPIDAVEPVAEASPESTSHLCGMFVSDKPVPVEAAPRQPRFVRLPDQDASGLDAWHDKATGCVYCTKHGEDPNETQEWFAEGSLAHLAAAVVEPKPVPAKAKSKKRRK